MCFSTIEIPLLDRNNVSHLDRRENTGNWNQNYISYWSLYKTLKSKVYEEYYVSECLSMISRERYECVFLDSAVRYENHSPTRPIGMRGP
jgi:hypothetical protein